MTRSDRRRVAITGAGAVSGFGIGAEKLWQSLKSGDSAIRPLRHESAPQLRVRVAAQVPEDCNLEDRVPESLRPLLDRTSLLALVAAREAVEQSGLSFGDAAFAARCGVIIGSGVSGDGTRDAQSRLLYEKHATRLHPLTIVRLMSNAPASLVSMAHGLKGPAFVVASACASANHAMAQAALLIRTGMADLVVTGGAESALSYGSLRAWESMRVLSDDTCRPFSANRRGLVMGEGAAMFVFEAMESARARGAPILAELSGIGMSADAGDITVPDMIGSSAAMCAALADADFAPGDIDYINAHGTGTVINDEVETRAIRAAFGAHAAAVAISSTKSMHGHALGAAGALELIAVLGALRDGVVAPTMNLDEPDPRCDLDYVPNVARDMPVRAALSNSFAFGGLNAVLALSRA